jgi:hypothetical protein
LVGGDGQDGENPEETMGRRCGCTSESCSCTIQAGDGIAVSGTGSATNPYKIENTQQASFTVADSASVDLALTGAGTPEDPTVLTAVATLTIPSVSITTFTTSGTWNRPTGKSIAHVTVIGAGGGGGSGGRSNTTSFRTGGGAGAGGGCSIHDFYITELPTTVTVTIGAGGSGGTGVTTNTTVGNNGSPGGLTSFGTLLRAGGGSGGRGGTIDGTPNTPVDVGGGSGIEDGGTGWGRTPLLYNGRGGSGGGPGGGIDVTNTVFAAQGGTFHSVFQIAGGVAGSSPGGVGGAGNNGYSSTTGGTGGGGGGASATGTPGAGGAGVRGGGGGGGGASSNGNTSGAGGNGGNGYCSVAVW